MKRLIVIEGPTASGKTDLSIALAKHFSTIILSADSRQFYKEMLIGTAKPTSEEQKGIKHYFIDSHSIFQEFTSAEFANDAMEILLLEFQKHDNIVLVGGSGMFIDALLYGLDEIPKSNKIRDQLNAELEEKGLEFLLKELKLKDPAFYETVDKQNPVRVIRALEVIRLTGKPFSEQRKNQKRSLPFTVDRFIIEHDREKLYDRINRRVDIMVENGLIEEAKELYPHKDLNALKTVGYSELFSFFDGNVSKEEAIESIKQNSRRYAKRQLTWFRKHQEAAWIKFDTTEKMTENILAHLKPNK